MNSLFYISNYTNCEIALLSSYLGMREFYGNVSGSVPSPSIAPPARGPQEADQGNVGNDLVLLEGRTRAEQCLPQRPQSVHSGRISRGLWIARWTALDHDARQCSSWSKTISISFFSLKINHFRNFNFQSKDQRCVIEFSSSFDLKIRIFMCSQFRDQRLLEFRFS